MKVVIFFVLMMVIYTVRVRPIPQLISSSEFSDECLLKLTPILGNDDGVLKEGEAFDETCSEATIDVYVLNPAYPADEMNSKCILQATCYTRDQKKKTNTLDVAKYFPTYLGVKAVCCPHY
jgi:hypothetical protein